MRSSLLNTTLFLAAAVGSLVLLNVLGVVAFGRVDMTRDNVYTLSKASKGAVADLEDPITVTAYFTENLPAPYSANARYVRDLLQEYRAASKGKLSFEFIDPSAQESAADKETRKELKQDIFGRTFREPTEVEKELAQTGIQSVEIRVVEEDQMQTKRAYMGIALRLGEKKEVIPVVQDTSTLEYDLTSLIRKMSRAKKPVIAVLQGHEEPKLEDQLRNLQALFSQTYDVRPLDLSSKEKVDDDVDALWVIGPKTALKPNELKAIDQFLMQGKAAAFFVDLAQVDLRTFQPTEVNAGLADLLKTYGVTVGDKLVADVQSAQLNVEEQRGFMRVAMPVRYPFIPILQQLEGDSPITKGLSGVTLPFSAEVKVSAPVGTTGAVLAKSSPKSWLEGKPFNTDPRREWGNEKITFDGAHPLVVQVSGKLKSHFASEALATSGATPALGESKSDARVIVSGGSMWLWNELLGRPNQAFALNVADWLLLDPAMLQMRTRGMAEAPLQQELSAATRNSVKFGAMLGLPFLLAMVGVGRWMLREGRRASVSV
ncbi:MAG: GldG family protein [Myxococcaceae bacterium]